MSDRFNWTVCGRAIGTATGWDQIDTFTIVLYEFIPAEGLELPTGDASIDFESGKMETFDDEGVCLESVDFIPIFLLAPHGSLQQ